MIPTRIRDITAQRLSRQFLLRPHDGAPVDVVRALGAVQAQDYAGAKWALGQRTRGVTNAELDRALDDGRILRTHVLRPTWHFVAPPDIRWMLALTAPRVKAAMAYYDRVAELTPEVYRRTNAVIERGLRDGKHLLRRELGAVIAHAGIPGATGQRLAHIVMRAELEGIVCSGPRRGDQFTYALLEERVPATASMEREEALGELARRYFATHGPATTHDFAWWSGLTIADAKHAVKMLASELASITTDDAALWFTPNERVRSTRSAHLLPNYDEYFIGHRDRSAIAVRLGSASLVTGGNALIGNVVVIDGQLVGSWTRRLEKGGVAIGMSMHTTLSAEERRRVESQTRRYADFLGIEPELRWTRSRR